jgi:hypothetical protein
MVRQRGQAYIYSDRKNTPAPLKPARRFDQNHSTAQNLSEN